MVREHHAIQQLELWAAFCRILHIHFWNFNISSIYHTTTNNKCWFQKTDMCGYRLAMLFNFIFRVVTGSRRLTILTIACILALLGQCSTSL